MRPCGKPFLKTERASPGSRSLRASAQTHSILLFISESRQLPGMKGTSRNVSLTRETVTTIAGRGTGLSGRVPLRGSAPPATAPRRRPPHPRPALRSLRTAEFALRKAICCCCSPPRAATAGFHTSARARRFEHIALSRLAPRGWAVLKGVLWVTRTFRPFPTASVLFMCKAHSVTAEKVQLIHKAPAGSGHSGSNNAGTPAPFLGSKSHAKCSGIAAPNSRNRTQNLG